MPSEEEFKTINLPLIIQNNFPKYTIINSWKIFGGITAKTYGFELQDLRNINSKFILRIFDNENIPKHRQKTIKEYELLNILKNTNIPVQIPFLMDVSGNILTYPFLILQFIDGSTNFDLSKNNEFVNVFTSILIAIHKTILSDKINLILGRCLNSHSEIVQEILKNQNISKDIKTALLQLQDISLTKNDNVLIHGDFWLGNILWQNNKLVGVIDWEDACIGDPLLDVANARLELLLAFNEESMNVFTSQYKTVMHSLNYDYLPLWDLFCALKIHSSYEQWYEHTSRKSIIIEKYKWFLHQAQEKLKKLFKM